MKLRTGYLPVETIIYSFGLSVISKRREFGEDLKKTRKSFSVNDSKILSLTSTNVPGRTVVLFMVYWSNSSQMTALIVPQIDQFLHISLATDGKQTDDSTPFRERPLTTLSEIDWTASESWGELGGGY